MPNKFSLIAFTILFIVSFFIPKIWILSYSFSSWIIGNILW